MSQVVENSITIYEAMQKIKNGNFAMPAFQRQYVWSLYQIERLWDSILLNYPIATFLFWRVDESNVTGETYFCDFLQQATFDNKNKADELNYDLRTINTQITSTAILDGQQRLTSLFLTLYGRFYKRAKHARKTSYGGTVVSCYIELDENKLDIDEEEYNSKKFDVRFMTGMLSPTQFEIRRILHSDFHNKDETRDSAIEKAIERVPPVSKKYARQILQTLCKRIYDEKLIRYTELIHMGQEDALEMFVRFNSGGSTLKKHEITMSIYEAYWPRAKEEFGRLLTGSFSGFGTDFIIRTALMLFGDVLKSNVNKAVADTLKNEWSSFKDTLTKLDKLLIGMKIDISRFASSWNILLPIIYYIYNNNDYSNNIKAIMAYLTRALFFTYFQSGTTAKLSKIKTAINEYNYKLSLDMLDSLRELECTEAKIEDVLNHDYGSRVASEVLYYINLDWLNKNYNYEQDHLHPASKFESKPFGVSMDKWGEWRKKKDNLSNLFLLEGRSNGSKNDMPLLEYYNQMNDMQKQEFITQALIPKGISLELQNFGEFYDGRKKLIEEKIKKLLLGI